MSIKNILKNLPHLPGVYLMKDKDANVLYVGKAKDLSKRVPSYFHSDLPSPWIKVMVGQIADIETITVKTEFEALLLENNLIKKFKPQFNIRMRDDKTFPFLKFTNEEFPRLVVTRKIVNDGGKYFGPYLSAFALRSTIEFLRKTYGIVTHSYKIGQRPCLNHQIGLCSAPYAGMISKEEYIERVNLSVKFIKGEYKNLLKELQAKMKKEAKKMNFENAANIRNQIDIVNNLVSSQAVVSTKQTNRDIFAVYKIYETAVCSVLKVRSGKLLYASNLELESAADTSEGDLLQSVISQFYLNNFDIPKEIIVSHPFLDEDIMADILSERDGRIKIGLPNNRERKELADIAMQNAEQNARTIVNRLKINEEILIMMQKDLNLKKLPIRIEAFDISNLGTTNAVGAMVVFQKSLPYKDHYRKFIIKSVEGQDDFAMMAEVVRRRYKNKDLPKPDLILIDGGQGQLGAAVEELSKLGFGDIPIIGLAKRYELIFIPDNKRPIILNNDSKSLLLLRQIRDEVHRFVIGFHRERRGKRLLRSYNE